jgi:hypothetical protein
VSSLPRVALRSLIEERKDELKEVAQGVATRDGAKTASAIAMLVLALATGNNPATLLLSPFLEEGLRRAFALSATKRMLREDAQLETKRERVELLESISKSVEELLGQALIQIVRAQRSGEESILAALGGLRDDLEDFREDFESRLEDSDVRVDVQRVREGATGILVSDEAASPVRVSEMIVSGRGSVGIHVGRRRKR